jgi:hypothetical protein
MVRNAIVNNISAISWRSVLLVEETGKNIDLPQVTDKYSNQYWWSKLECTNAPHHWQLIVAIVNDCIGTGNIHVSLTLKRSYSPSRPICINVYVINAWYTYNTTNIMQYTIYVYSDMLIFTDNNTWSSWICGLMVVWLTYKSKMYIPSKASELRLPSVLVWPKEKDKDALFHKTLLFEC